MASFTSLQQVSQNDGAPSARSPLPGHTTDSGNYDLREFYRRFFDTLIADDERLLTEAYRLRYQVYCVENPFEDPAENPHGLESDEDDVRSVHCLLRHKPSGAMAGTVRIVLHDPACPEQSFALQRICRDQLIRDPERFPVDRMVEISRFCISKTFRQRKGDGLYPGSNESGAEQDQRRLIPNMTLGLIEGLVRMSLDHDITHWCAMMEPTLLRLLTRLGIHFDKIGPIVDYHGRRQPCYIPLDTMLERVQDERPDVWDVLTEGGSHWETLRRKSVEKGQ